MCSLTTHIICIIMTINMKYFVSLLSLIRPMAILKLTGIAWMVGWLDGQVINVHYFVFPLDHHLFIHCLIGGHLSSYQEWTAILHLPTLMVIVLVLDSGQDNDDLWKWFLSRREQQWTGWELIMIIWTNMIYEDEVLFDKGDYEQSTLQKEENVNLLLLENTKTCLSWGYK